MPDDASRDLIDQMADATVRIVDANIALLKRVADGHHLDPEPGDPSGPVQDAWETWADCAGDMVTISYLGANLVDAVLGFHSAPTQDD